MLEVPPVAMIMAAGFGTRLRPLTNDLPKALVKVRGKALIEYALDKLIEIQVPKIVINLHYKAQLLQEFVESLKLPKTLELIFSYEEEPLEAAGMVKAKAYFANQPVLVLNGDNIWLDDPGGEPDLMRLWRNFDQKHMNMLMLLQQRDLVLGHDGLGDFDLVGEKEPYGICYKGAGQSHSYVFTGPRIVASTLIDKMPVIKFHLFKDFLYKMSLKEDRMLDLVYGIKHNGCWMDIGNLEGLRLAEQFLEKLGTY